ncbi:MAG: FecR family protein [Spirochaetales bacterium]|nr:FecR family protein [Spirochaetales bacterium]
MNDRSRIVLVLALSVISTVAMGAQELGRITYIEGDVELVRDGEQRDAFEIQIGEPIFEFDVIQTGFDGYIEVEVAEPARGTIRVRENSAYYVERSSTPRGVTVQLNVLSGGVEIDADAVSEGTTLQVRTRSAVLGVRGTRFDVLTAPDEATLLGVREGTVVLVAGGEEITAEAGAAVEALPDGRTQAQVVPGGDFQRYYARWTETRLQAFRSGASTFIRAYTRRYEDTKPTFLDAYERLVAYRERLREAEAQGGGPLGDQMRLRAEIGPALIAMRSIFPLFEDTVYRLRELGRFHDQGIGHTQIDGNDSERFFREFAAEEREVTSRLAEVRSIFRMYRAIEARGLAGFPEGLENPFDDTGTILDSMRF